MEWDRTLLAKRNIIVSDTDLDSFFNPWHRESRAYEHIDDHIKGPERFFFPEYYGTAKVPYSSCPDAWRRNFPDDGDVCIIVLELLEKSRFSPGLSELRLSESLLMTAKRLYSELGDYEYVHIFVHLSEMVDILHQIKIIHSDVKPDNLIDYSVTKSSVLFDFSRSWVSIDSLPCLDPFKKEPKTFEERRDSELDGVRRLVLLYAYFALLLTKKLTLISESKSCDAKRFLRKKFPKSTDCRRCTNVMEEIIS
jgi:serine/threonine protein kinase